MTTQTLAPRQARSRETEKKLIKATIELLREFGLEAATIPRVAERAGLTPGAIYRRFPDKNALIEQVVMRIIEAQTEQLQKTLPVSSANAQTLPALVESLVRTSLEGHRQHATLLRALRQFVQASDHQAFKNQAADHELKNLEHMTQVLMTHQQHIRHPDPKMAISLAFAMLTGTLTALFIDDEHMTHWKHMIPTDSETLARELTRLFLNYLDVIPA